MPSEPLEIERLFADMGGRGVLCLKGPLTAENLPSFQSAILRENVPTMILDFSEVPYIDSAGLGSLVSVYVSRKKMGQRLALTGVNPGVNDDIGIDYISKGAVLRTAGESAGVKYSASNDASSKSAIYTIIDTNIATS